MALDDAITAADAAERLMEGAEYLVHSTQVLGVVAATQVSACDGEFVVLARRLQAPLVTFDRRLRAAFPDLTEAPEAFAG